MNVSQPGAVEELLDRAEDVLAGLLDRAEDVLTGWYTSFDAMHWRPADADVVPPANTLPADVHHTLPADARERALAYRRNRGTGPPSHRLDGRRNQ